MSQWKSALACAIVAVGCAGVHAQSFPTLPEVSQRAVVTQRVGLTDVTVTYHRPLIAGRKVWGGLAPKQTVVSKAVSGMQ